jgi:copper chaperone CopZ
MRTLILGLLALCISASGYAQFSKAKLQASGLTCAMCARSVYKNLEALSFVDSIGTDLEQSSFLITLRPGVDVDADQIRKKVEDAGFSVADLRLEGVFEPVKVGNDRHVTLNGRTYHFLDVPEQSLGGKRSIRFVDRDFLATKEQKKYAAMASGHACYKSGRTEECCRQAGVKSDGRVYHVTL